MGHVTIDARFGLLADIANLRHKRRHAEDTQEYLAPVRARPIVAEPVDPVDLRTPWQELESHSSARQRRLTNGGPSLD